MEEEEGVSPAAVEAAAGALVAAAVVAQAAALAVVLVLVLAAALVVVVSALGLGKVSWASQSLARRREPVLPTVLVVAESPPSQQASHSQAARQVAARGTRCMARSKSPGCIAQRQFRLFAHPPSQSQDLW